MAVDTPATIAILGAGPIGLEAALYARYLGYDVLIFERGNEVADHVRQWGHVRMFTPFGQNYSPLGLAAVQMHHADYVPPGDEELLTGEEWRQKYLLPLAETDLLADHLRLGRTIVGVCRTEISKIDVPYGEERGDWMFRIVSRDAEGRDYEDEAEIVIDATGTFSNPNWAGEGGLPALGEIAARERGAIEYGLPDILGEEREKYYGQHTLVLGSGYSAGTNLLALSKLIQYDPATKLTWVVQNEVEPGESPLEYVDEDHLPPRNALALEVEELVKQNAVRLVTGSWLRRIETDPPTGKLAATIAGQESFTETFDQIVANRGHHPDRCLHQQLQVREDHCTERVTENLSSLLTTEPNFYVLGSKSWGRNGNFLVTTGFNQIRNLFAIIGDRPTLDLYANAPRIED